MRKLLFSEDDNVAILPKIPEPIRRQLGVPHRVLDVLVPQVVLDRPGVVPVVRQLEPTPMPQHVRMYREVEAGLAPCPGDQLAHR